MPVMQPNWPDPNMNTAMGTPSSLQEIQPNTDQDESAIAYVEASIAMLKNAGESLPSFQPGIKQIAQFMQYVLRQAIEGQGQAGPSVPPQEQPQQEPAGPAVPTY